MKAHWWPFALRQYNYSELASLGKLWHIYFQLWNVAIKLSLFIYFYIYKSWSSIINIMFKLFMYYIYLKEISEFEYVIYQFWELSFSWIFIVEPLQSLIFYLISKFFFRHFMTNLVCSSGSSIDSTKPLRKIYCKLYSPSGNLTNFMSSGFSMKHLSLWMYSLKSLL